MQNLYRTLIVWISLIWTPTLSLKRTKLTAKSNDFRKFELLEPLWIQFEIRLPKLDPFLLRFSNSKINFRIFETFVWFSILNLIFENMRNSYDLNFRSGSIMIGLPLLIQRVWIEPSFRMMKQFHDASLNFQTLNDSLCRGNKKSKIVKITRKM